MAVTLDESISMAFLVVLESMTPAERVAFTLQDPFRYSFAEVAEIVGRTPAACRQLASSARRRLRGLAHRATNVTVLERTVDGQPGLLAQRDGVTVAVHAFHVIGDQIKHIWVILNPDKIRPWTRASRTAAPAESHRPASPAHVGAVRDTTAPDHHTPDRCLVHRSETRRKEPQP